jgi:hypothetical protein
MNRRIAVLRGVRNHLGIVGTEAGSDWLIPYVDYTTSRFNRGANTGTDPDHQDAIPVPLYDLVYHDAVVTAATPNNLRSLLYGNAPQTGLRACGFEWRTGAPDGLAARSRGLAGDDQPRIPGCGAPERADHLRGWDYRHSGRDEGHGRNKRMQMRSDNP